MRPSTRLSAAKVPHVRRPARTITEAPLRSAARASLSAAFNASVGARPPRLGPRLGPRPGSRPEPKFKPRSITIRPKPPAPKTISAAISTGLADNLEEAFDRKEVNPTARDSV